MKKLIAVLIISISISGFAQIGEKNFIDQNYIEVTGKAELEIVPDLIYVRILLFDKNNKDKQTLPEMEKKMTEKLKEIGIDVNKDLSLMDFASNFKYYLFKTDVIILKKQYQLIVHDSKTLQKVFIEFQKLGISDVSIQKLDNSKIEQYRKDVKVSAVKAAKEKAELIATALNQKVGKAIFVQEVDYLNINSALQGRVSGVYGYSAASNIKIRGTSYDNHYESEDSDIEFEKIKIDSTFLVRFGLE